PVRQELFVGLLLRLVALLLGHLGTLVDLDKALPAGEVFAVKESGKAPRGHVVRGRRFFVGDGGHGLECSEARQASEDEHFLHGDSPWKGLDATARSSW